MQILKNQTEDQIDTGLQGSLLTEGGGSFGELVFANSGVELRNLPRLLCILDVKQ